MGVEANWSSIPDVKDMLQTSGKCLVVGKGKGTQQAGLWYPGLSFLIKECNAGEKSLHRLILYRACMIALWRKELLATCLAQCLEGVSSPANNKNGHCLWLSHHSQNFYEERTRENWFFVSFNDLSRVTQRGSSDPKEAVCLCSFNDDIYPWCHPYSITFLPWVYIDGILTICKKAYTF